MRSQLRKHHLVRELKDKQHAPVASEDSQLSIGQLHIDQSTHKTSLNGEEVELTSTEFMLLTYLASHPDQVFSRAQLLSSVWGYHHSGYEHTVNSHINRLRNKLEKDATQPEIVQTVWGVGYKFNPVGVAV